MRHVFLNTFDKLQLGGETNSAQLAICERDGVWSIVWSDGVNEADNWFEGTSWEELMLAFRHGIAVKMGEGYKPVIDGMLDERKNAEGGMQQMLQCYGELHANKELFETLRSWRRAAAAAEKKSSYLVATNRMLWMISAFVPQTPEELLQIPGWGENKHAAYGEQLLEITASAEQTRGFPLHWVAEELEPSVFTGWLFKQKESKYGQELQRLRQKKRILAFASDGGSLEQLQSELELSRRELMDRIEQLDKEGYDFEGMVARELASMPQPEHEQILLAFAQEGDRYLKPVLQQVYGSESVKEKQVEVLYEKLRLVRLQYRKSNSRAIS
ncbi:HRDC domain-containing protein [Paenibacillus sp. NPDC058071]|uniref:HRDC domain-containing protein n=1 Tax=Paenibacillus sp. NPDC058071 TaxID=3346326 RepID=UPI0036DE7C26